MVGANGSQYALTLTDTAKARAFYNTKSQYLDGVSWKASSTIGGAFKNATTYFEDKYESDPDKNNLSHEMAMAAVLKQYDVGITLNKKDASGHFKPLVVATKPDTKTPKRKVYTQECN